VVRSRNWADWLFFKNNDHLSIIDVIEFGTIDYKLAGLFWLIMEYRASVIVAAGPSWAGKTTLFHSVLDFLRPETEQVTLRGYDEDFTWLGNGKPENTYLVTEEISNHQYEYLWGYQVAKAFGLLNQGYALGATIHARDIREVSYILNALGVSAPLIAGLGMIITLQVAPGRSRDDEPVRYVDTVSTLSQTDDGLVAQILAYRKSAGDGFTYIPEQMLHETLSRKFGIKYSSVSSEIEHRGQYLHELHARDIRSREEIREAVAEYYRRRLI